jgi:O-methyltransferase involved in polyketide biosynthesis
MGGYERDGNGMNDKIKIELGEVQKTLLMPLWGRAKEYLRENPFIKDKFAFDLVNRIDHDFERMNNAYDEHYQINWAVRARCIDQAVLKVMEKYPDATIVNIGAGLDTAFQRVDNGRIYWYDLDLPDTIALRRKLIPESARNVYIAKSALDPGWYGEIMIRGPKIFFIAGGVLVYFRREEVKKLFLGLAKEFSGSEMIFEIMSPFLIWLSNRAVVHQKKQKSELAFMNWGCSSSKQITKWSDKIRVVEEYPFYSRINIRPEWSRQTLRQIKLVNSFKWVKMVHLEFSK